MARAGSGGRGGLAGLLESFFRTFAEMPHRGSGTSFEPRAARQLSAMAGQGLHARTELQGFAVDFSSGAWNVAIHGVALIGLLLASWTGGLLAAAVWGLGGHSVDLGLLGRVPWPFTLAAFASCLVCLFSRIAAGVRGWNLVSFFVPNADSANVIISTLAPPGADQLRARQEDAWKSRFRESGKKRLLVLAAHYDSARCFPPMMGSAAPPRWLMEALKNGIGLLPTIAYLALAAVLGTALVLGLADIDPFDASVAAWVLRFLVLAAIVLGIGTAGLEALISSRSADLPFNPGLNDNLSGVAVIFGALTRILPLDGTSGLDLRDTVLMAVFTGSEENGLRGSSEFSRSVLAPAVGVFGADRVMLVNLDSVSGPGLIAAPSERTFSAGTRGGKLRFAEQAVELLSSPFIPAVLARAEMSQAEIDACLTGPGPYGCGIRLEKPPLAACTDLTGFCSGKGLNHVLKVFSLVSKVPGSGPPPQPRDYHQRSDGLETLFLASEPENFGSVVMLAMGIEELVAKAEAGLFD